MNNFESNENSDSSEIEEYRELSDISAEEMRMHITNKTTPKGIPKNIFYVEKLKFLDDVRKNLIYDLG